MSADVLFPSQFQTRLGKLVVACEDGSPSLDATRAIVRLPWVKDGKWVMGALYLSIWLDLLPKELNSRQSMAAHLARHMTP